MLRQLFIVLILLVFAGTIYGQAADKLMGVWMGKIEAGPQSFRFVFHFKDSNGTLACTIDSPDQGATNLPTKGVSFINGNVRVDASNLGATYTGIMQPGDSLIEGSWAQDGTSFALDLVRQAEAVKPHRPQTPAAPFPYTTAVVKIENGAAGAVLSGTLTIPKVGGPFPAVLLITGMGPQNRDDEVAGHKPYWVVADYLARNGIASLRFDDRGVGQSSGKFSTAVTSDFVSDAEAAFKVLLSNPRINKRKVGILGRDEGAVVGAMVAAAEPRVAFLVLLAGLGQTGEQALLTQARMVSLASGMPESAIREMEALNKEFYRIVRETPDNGEAISKLMEKAWAVANSQESLTSDQRKQLVNDISSSFSMLVSPWYRGFLLLNPAVYFSKVKVPVLAINGSHDLIISADENLAAIENSLKEGGNTNFRVLKMEDLNHLFQRSTRGLPSEYGTIEETISPDVLRIVKDWIKNDVAPLPVKK